MSYPTWPDALPSTFLQEGYSENEPYSLTRTEMDVGPAKTRRRSTASVRPISGAIRMTFAQKETFKTFFESTLSGGASKFIWTIPGGSTEAVFRFTAAPAYGLAPGGTAWDVQVSVEVLPEPVP